MRPSIMMAKPKLCSFNGVKTIIKDPKSNKTRAPRNIVLKEKLFSNQGLEGILMHITSIKPVVSHWIVAADK